MRFLLKFIFILKVTVTLTFAQQESTTISGRKVLLKEDGTWVYVTEDSSSSDNAQTNFEIPQLNPGEYMIEHSGFSLSYNEQHEQPSWVAYELTEEETHSSIERTNKFLAVKELQKKEPSAKTGRLIQAGIVTITWDR